MAFHFLNRWSGLDRLPAGFGIDMLAARCCFGYFVRQKLACKLGLVIGNDNLVDEMLELADIAGPIVSLKQFHSLR